MLFQEHSSQSPLIVFNHGVSPLAGTLTAHISHRVTFSFSAWQCRSRSPNSLFLCFYSCSDIMAAPPNDSSYPLRSKCQGEIDFQESFFGVRCESSWKKKEKEEERVEGLPSSVQPEVCKGGRAERRRRNLRLHCSFENIFIRLMGCFRLKLSIRRVLCPASVHFLCSVIVHEQLVGSIPSAHTWWWVCAPTTDLLKKFYWIYWSDIG